MQYGIIRCIKVIRGARCPFWATFGRRLGVHLGQGHQVHGSYLIFVWRLGKYSIFNIFSILNIDKSTGSKITASPASNSFSSSRLRTSQPANRPSSPLAQADIQAPVATESAASRVVERASSGLATGRTPPLGRWGSWRRSRRSGLGRYVGEGSVWEGRWRRWRGECHFYFIILYKG